MGQERGAQPLREATPGGEARNAAESGIAARLRTAVVNQNAAAVVDRVGGPAAGVECADFAISLKRGWHSIEVGEHRPGTYLCVMKLIRQMSDG